MKLLAALLLLVATGAGAQSIDIKNARLGMTQAEVRTLFPALRECTPTKDNSALACGDPANSYGGAKASLFFIFAKDAATAISVRFESKEFDSIIAALIAKYGNADTIETPVLTNRMGAKFQSTEMTWRRGQDILMAQRYGSSLDQSVIYLTSEKSINDFQQRKKDETTNRAKDL